jgi:hypothetical protein
MMSPEEQRDRRRMDAYRAMLRAESNAAESERLQAAKNLAELEAKWPGPPPEEPDEDPFGGFAGFAGFGFGRRGWSAPEEPPPPPDPAQEARRAKEREDWERRKRQRAAEEEGRAMHQVVERQRAQVVGVPFWMLDPTLVRLHAADTPWTTEEHVLFTRARKDALAGPDRDRAEVSAALVALGKAWGEPALGDAERASVEAELQSIATSRVRVSALAWRWLQGRR